MTMIGTKLEAVLLLQTTKDRLGVRWGYPHANINISEIFKNIKEWINAVLCSFTTLSAICSIEG